MSLIRDAFADWRKCRAEFDLHLYAAYARAEESTNGCLLNSRGLEREINQVSLFMGPWVRARAYASEELLENWEQYPRLTYSEYERQWANQREEVGA